MASTQLGFFMVLILFILKLFAIAFEWWGTDRKRLHRRLQASAGITTSFILILGCVTLSFGASISDSDGHCKDADADIVGDGVRAATWTQQCILSLIAMCGCFHEAPTAVKEVGAGLLVTHISLTIALMVPLTRGNLSMVDAVLGSMILDGQNTALSIQLSTKETLAARWQVWVVIIGQTIGLLASAILIGCFQRNFLRTEECECFSAFWWTWFSNCSSSTSNDIYPVWTYFAFRCITFLQSACIALKHTGRFDLAKKREDENPCSKCSYCQRSIAPQAKSSSEIQGTVIKMNSMTLEDHESKIDEDGCCTCKSKTCKPCSICQECRQCKNCGCGRGSGVLTEQDGLVNGRKFSQLTATTSLLCYEYGALSLLSMLAAQNMITVQQIQISSQVYAVGQVATIVIAGGTAIRALWVTGFMFIKEVS